jgi:RecB family exonuclease
MRVEKGLNTMERILTIDHLDAATTEWIEQEARRLGVPVETVVRRLIQRGIAAERDEVRSPLEGDLATLAGTWSAEEAAEFLQVTADFNQVDPTLWP